MGTITRKTKEKTKKRPKDVQPAATKEGREPVPLVIGSYLTHSPSNVVSRLSHVGEKPKGSCTLDDEVSH
jgi:hypothetical protein